MCAAPFHVFLPKSFFGPVGYKGLLLPRAGILAVHDFVVSRTSMPTCCVKNDDFLIGIALAKAGFRPTHDRRRAIFIKEEETGKTFDGLLGKNPLNGTYKNSYAKAKDIIRCLLHCHRSDTMKAFTCAALLILLLLAVIASFVATAVILAKRQGSVQRFR